MSRHSKVNKLADTSPSTSFIPTQNTTLELDSLKNCSLQFWPNPSGTSWEKKELKWNTPIQMKCIFWHTVQIKWLASMVTFFKGGPSPACFSFIFIFSYIQLFSSQPDSNLDCPIRRRGCWPLDHHHCPSFNGNFTSCGIAGQPIVINHLGILNLISKFCYESCWGQKKSALILKLEKFDKRTLKGNRKKWKVTKPMRLLTFDDRQTSLKFLF